MPSEFIQRRVDRLLGQAEEAADKLDWDRVVTSAQMILSVDPENSEAASLLKMVEVALSGVSTSSSTVSVAQLVPGIDVVWIEAAVPDHPDGYSAEDLSLAGIEGCVKDPCLMGFRGADLKVVANNEFLENNPSAKKLFEVMSIPLGDIFKQNNRMNAGENSQDEIDLHAEEWIALNRDLFDSWIAQARQAGQAGQ